MEFHRNRTQFWLMSEEEKMFILIASVTAITLVAILTLGIAIIQNIATWLGVVFIGVLLFAFLKNGFKTIQAAPPHKGILTVWGERQKEVLKEGLHFFPFYRWWFGFIPVKVEKINHGITR